MKQQEMKLWHRPRGKILALKLGYNPNSSSLGVDVTFLLFGTAAVTVLTPLVGFLLRRLGGTRLKPAGPQAAPLPSSGPDP
ncbi:MAG: hypothetical protein NZ890_19215 [Myxococcota bacterium]|nr:hypothetical protein [Myxococcota bacterium]